MKQHGKYFRVTVNMTPNFGYYSQRCGHHIPQTDIYDKTLYRVVKAKDKDEAETKATKDVMVYEQGSWVYRAHAVEI